MRASAVSRVAEPVDEQGAVGESGQLVVERPVGEGGLLVLQLLLETAVGVVELPDDPDQAAVAAEADHPPHEGGHLGTGREAGGLLVDHADRLVPPCVVGLRHVGELGGLEDGLLALAGELGRLRVRRGLVGGDPPADQLGCQAGGGEGLSPEGPLEAGLDHPADLLGPGLQGQTESDPLGIDLARREVGRPCRRGSCLGGAVSRRHRVHACRYRQPLGVT